MSFEDQLVTTVEDRLLFLDKNGSGIVQYLVVRSSGGAHRGDAEAEEEEGEEEEEKEKNVCEEIGNFKLRRLTNVDLVRNVHDFAACELNNFLYVTGGFHLSDLQYGARTLRFDPTRNKWQQMKPMRKARSKHSMVVYDGWIIVAGGETSGGKVTRSCERYDAVGDEWSDFARLPAHRCWMACATFRGELYASGGFCSGRGHDNMWIYERKGNMWSNLDRHFPIRLPHFVDRHLMVALDDTLYFFGGVEYSKSAVNRDERQAATRALSDGYRPQAAYTESGNPNDFEARRQLLDRVTPWVYGLPDMLHARHSTSCVVLGGKLYLFGGTNIEYKSSVNAIDLFSPRTATWTEEGTLRGESLGNPICAKLRFSETRVVKRALPRSWPLW